VFCQRPLKFIVHAPVQSPTDEEGAPMSEAKTEGAARASSPGEEGSSGDGVWVGPEADADDAAPGGRFDRLRRPLLVNGVIGLALAVVVALIVWSVRGDAGEATQSTAQTSTVDTGEVTATVSANGNVAAGSTVEASFEAGGGVVRKIYVEPGEKVRRGQALARVDQTSARQSLATARAQLVSAQAAYATTVQGQTAQEQALDATSVQQAQVTVSSAQQNVANAQQTLALTRQQQEANVRRAEQSVADAQQAAQEARRAYRRDPSVENEQALQTAEDALAAARSTLATTRATRTSSIVQAQQQVETQQQALRSAQASLSSTRASVAVNQQPARDGEVESAQAQVESAEVTVQEALTAVDQTVLRAPVAGTVATVSGTVGESSTASGSSGSTDTSTGTETSATSDSSSGGGFVTLTDTRTLQVTADVAEADIAEVQLGQPVTLTLSASGREIDGQVTGVDVVETVTNNVVEYGVTVTLDRSNGVKLGQSTQVVITTGTKEGVVRVSSSALTTVGDTTTATVQAADGTTSTVPVVTGLEGDGYTEVLDGLSDGDVVVLADQGEQPTEFTFPGGGGLGGIG
jgi:HlyD family secretion protein